MAIIDRDLLSNKPNCYVFDIDGCLADISEILITHKQSHDLAMREYEKANLKYENDSKEFDKKLKAYNKGLLPLRPIDPIRPEFPIKPDRSDEKKIDWKYFSDHLLEAIPISGVLDLFINIALSHKVILLTGRSEDDRYKTIEWLKKVIIEKGGDDLYRRINFQLIMRSDKETSMSIVEYKRIRILEITKQYNIQLIIEDHPKIVEEFTRLGLAVLTPNRKYYEVG